MKSILLLLLIILTSCSSCSKVEICKDKDLTLHRANYMGNQLKVDGFYYGNPDTDFQGVTRYQIFVLYRNGIVFLPGGDELGQLENYLVSVINAQRSMIEAKYEWGLYTINNSLINIEHWEPGQCSYPVSLKTGEIINDTTFILTEIITKSNRGTDYKDINQTFHFRPFSPKPDSINSFIE